MTRGRIPIICLEESCISRATEVMVHAFESDPVVEYIFQENAGDQDQVSVFFGAGLRYGMAYGEVYTTSDVDGVAVWLGPGNATMSLWGLIRTGVVFAPFKMKKNVRKRFFEILQFTAEIQKKYVPGDHWYLLELAVDPAIQGRGIGSALLGPVLEKADNDHLPCYLETFSERAAGFYERHGFRVVYEDNPLGGVSVCRFMLREPQGVT